MPRVQKRRQPAPSAMTLSMTISDEILSLPLALLRSTGGTF